MSDTQPANEGERMAARYHIIHETTEGKPKEEWNLCFQWGRYIYEDGSNEMGYRFIYRYPPNHNLQPARAQARLISINQIEKLLQQSKDEGWGDLSGE